MSDTILPTLGLARRANLLAIGTEKVTDALKTGKARLVVIASDISEKSEKELRYLANNKVEILRISADLSTLSAAIGIRAGILAVTDSGLAGSICRKAGSNNG